MGALTGLDVRGALGFTMSDDDEDEDEDDLGESAVPHATHIINSRISVSDTFIPAIAVADGYLSIVYLTSSFIASSYVSSIFLLIALFGPPNIPATFPTKSRNIDTE
jgi:hypothetical protein